MRVALWASLSCLFVLLYRMIGKQDGCFLKRRDALSARAGRPRRGPAENEMKREEEARKAARGHPSTFLSFWGRAIEQTRPIGLLACP